jgi:hypothetical protein
VFAPRKTVPLLAGAALALPAFLAGCGGDDVDVGPAAAVPANTPIYLEATVRPEGEAKTGAEGALGKILDTDDPGGELESLLEQSSEGELKPGEQFTFAEDVELWLGERAAIFFPSFEDDTDPTVVVESRDNEAALNALREDAGVSEEPSEYNGSSFYTDEDEGTVFGAVGDFIVSGPEEGFKQAVDAADGDNLGGSDQFKDSIEDLPDDSLGILYALPEDFLDAFPEDQIDPTGRRIFEQVAGDALDEPVVGDLTASAEAIELELSAGVGGLEVPDSSLIEALPAQAWLGLSLGNLGDSVNRTLESLEDEDLGGVDLDTIRSQVELATGVELDQFVDALGNGALFVQGVREANLTGALIVETEDAQVTGELLTRLQDVIERAGGASVRVRPLASTGGDVGFELVDPTGEQIPQPIQLVQQGDRIAIGYGTGSAQRALSGSEGAAGGNLSTTPGFAAAAGNLEALGVDLFLAFPPVFQLAENEGAGRDSGFVEAKPYIDALDYLAIGTGEDGDRAELRVVVGLK